MTGPIDPGIKSDMERIWALQIPDRVTEEDLLQLLVPEINRMILHDFSRLVSILYRVDIPESKLKATLQEHPKADAARVIAVMILERQKEKKRLREMFRQPPAEDDGAERW